MAKGQPRFSSDGNMSSGRAGTDPDELDAASANLASKAPSLSDATAASDPADDEGWGAGVSEAAPPDPVEADDGELAFGASIAAAVADADRGADETAGDADTGWAGATQADPGVNLLAAAADAQLDQVDSPFDGIADEVEGVDEFDEFESTDAMGGNDLDPFDLD